MEIFPCLVFSNFMRKLPLYKKIFLKKKFALLKKQFEICTNLITKIKVQGPPHTLSKKQEKKTLLDFFSIFPYHRDSILLGRRSLEN